jgi:hypothetical protein
MGSNWRRGEEDVDMEEVKRTTMRWTGSGGTRWPPERTLMPRLLWRQEAPINEGEMTTAGVGDIQVSSNE